MEEEEEKERAEETVTDDGTPTLEAGGCTLSYGGAGCLRPLTEDAGRYEGFGTAITGWTLLLISAAYPVGT